MSDHEPGYPGQPPQEAAWVKHASEAIVDALNNGATEVVFDVPTHQGNIVFDAAAYLARWKAEALEVLEGWERVWEAAGRPGPLGASKADNVAAYVINLAGELRDLGTSYAAAVNELAEFKQWASDACELLHDIEGLVESYSPPPSWSIVQESLIDLLRRMENP